MNGNFLTRTLGLAVALSTLSTPAAFAQPAAIGSVRGPGGLGMGPGSPGLGGLGIGPGAAGSGGMGMGPGAPGMAGRYGNGGGSYPYPGMIIPYYQGGYNYGGYDPMVASVPSAAYFTYGSTSYTTESPSPIPVYSPRPPFSALPPPMPLTALLKVQVPQDAEIWLEGQKMRSKGAARHFRSPPLNPTKGYGYEIRARWLSDGKPVEDVRHVPIRAGATILVDFTHLDPLVPRLSAPTLPTPPAKTEPQP